MPKDQYLSAKRKDIARRENSRRGFEQRQKQRERADKLRKYAQEFPKHEFIDNGDGSTISKTYIFSGDRWR